MVRIQLYVKKKCIYIPLQIDQQQIFAKFDTAAETSVMHPTLVKKLGLTTIPFRAQLQGLGSPTMPISRVAILQATFLAILYILKHMSLILFYGSQLFWVNCYIPKQSKHIFQLTLPTTVNHLQ